MEGIIWIWDDHGWPAEPRCFPPPRATSVPPALTTPGAQPHAEFGRLEADLPRRLSRHSLALVEEGLERGAINQVFLPHLGGG
jgi:hypothetical protein